MNLIDPWGENLVDSFPSEEAAQHAIAECKKEDATWETAKLLIVSNVSRPITQRRNRRNLIFKPQ